jgi:tetratricopeptide (TPR) repeat protein
MKKTLLVVVLSIMDIFFAGLVLAQDERSTAHVAHAAKTQSDAFGDQLGTVHFPVSCNAVARQHAVRGLALLHHMTYEGARDAFIAATQADVDCAMGYWGQAMSFIHPLWSDLPSESEFNEGQALVKLAKDRGQKSEWEYAYIRAVAAYYTEGRKLDEKANIARFEKAWYEVYQQFPEDFEAASFYALTHMATASKDAQGYVKQQRAAEIAKQVLDRVPDHPGAHHYIIHAYDSPALADKALAVARRYGGITSNVPHALHMPSHIFTRLGLWQESIEMNQRAATAALANPVDNTISLHYLHALDYLAYAYLQRADDAQAQQVLQTIQSLNKPAQVHVASAYTFAAIPARFVLERRQWLAASKLELGIPRDYPWDQFPAMQAITHFARALGAARSGNESVARKALDQLMVLQNQVRKTSESWVKQIEIQRLSAQAWLIYQQGKPEEALGIMRKAAEMEAATEKHPVTPGAILPAGELLADMYLALGKYQQAQAEYLAKLTRSPNRFNSLYGVARTAELTGDHDKAVLYYQKLVNMAATDSAREALLQAKAYLDN